MKNTNIISAALVAVTLIIVIPGCEKGPAEKVGASIDNAVEKTGDQINKTGDAIKDSANADNR